MSTALVERLILFAGDGWTVSASYGRKTNSENKEKKNND